MHDHQHKNGTSFISKIIGAPLFGAVYAARAPRWIFCEQIGFSQIVSGGGILSALFIFLFPPFIAGNDTLSAMVSLVLFIAYIVKFVVAWKDRNKVFSKSYGVAWFLPATSKPIVGDALILPLFWVGLSVTQYFRGQTPTCVLFGLWAVALCIDALQVHWKSREARQGSSDSSVAHGFYQGGSDEQARRVPGARPTPSAKVLPTEAE